MWKAGGASWVEGAGERGTGAFVSGGGIPWYREGSLHKTGGWSVGIPKAYYHWRKRVPQDSI